MKSLYNKLKNAGAIISETGGVRQSVKNILTSPQAIKTLKRIKELHVK